MLPSLQLLTKINFYAKQTGGANYCLFLLTYKAGLRVSEAVSFDYRVQQESFYLVKGKGKLRNAFVSSEIISELKIHHWQPNSLTRFGFYKFLRKVKKELKISSKIELSPHTLRRCWTTYQAENGVPLPVLSKGLGHKSVRTTALYWRSEKEVSEEVVREWLERKVLVSEISVEQIQVEKEEVYQQEVQKLEEENRLLRERVRELEKMNDLLVKKVKKQEGVNENDQRIKAQIELGAKRVYS